MLQLQEVPIKETRQKRELFYEIARWRIPKENSKKHLECWRGIFEEILELRKSHSEKFHYTRSRILQLAEGEEGSSEETWIWIDEYEDRQAYDRMMKATEDDPIVVKLKNQIHSKWDPLRVPGSFKAERWIERARSEPTIS